MLNIQYIDPRRRKRGRDKVLTPNKTVSARRHYSTRFQFKIWPNKRLRASLHASQCGISSGVVFIPRSTALQPIEPLLVQVIQRSLGLEWVESRGRDCWVVDALNRDTSRSIECIGAVDYVLNVSKLVHIICKRY